MLRATSLKSSERILEKWVGGGKKMTRLDSLRCFVDALFLCQHDDGCSVLIHPDSLSPFSLSILTKTEWKSSVKINP